MKTPSVLTDIVNARVAVVRAVAYKAAKDFYGVYLFALSLTAQGSTIR